MNCGGIAASNLAQVQHDSLAIKQLSEDQITRERICAHNRHHDSNISYIHTDTDIDDDDCDCTGSKITCRLFPIFIRLSFSLS